jgi:hypothetical protein
LRHQHDDVPDAGVFLAGDGEELPWAGDEAVGAAEECQDGVGLVDALMDGQVLEGALDRGGQVVGEVAGCFGVVDGCGLVAEVADSSHDVVCYELRLRRRSAALHAGSLARGLPNMPERDALTPTRAHAPTGFTQTKVGTRVCDRTCSRSREESSVRRSLA